MPRSKLPKGWPTVEGRFATREEITDYLAKTDAHYKQAAYPTMPHFCRGCTAPLEHEPCSVCARAQNEKNEKLRGLLKSNGC